ncbi:MAG: zinc-ribbon domain-containing protein [Streptosporangiaceae bacterium]
MLLIFGLSVYFRTVAQGMFHCPACGGDRTYRRRVGRRWISLFFVPVIPLNRLGEAVECRTCKTRFSVSVLRLPTAAAMADNLPAAMRAAAALVLTAGDPGDSAARTRAVDAVRGYGEVHYTEDELTGDLDMSADYLAEEISQAGTQLAVEAKEWFLAQTVRIALADGMLSDGERQALHVVAGRLGMTHAHALGVIVTTEGASR